MFIYYKMKQAIRPYNIDYVKDYLVGKRYENVKELTYTHYKKMFHYIYPTLSDYYIRNIILELIETEFFEIKYQGRRRYFKMKTKKSTPEQLGILHFE